MSLPFSLRAAHALNEGARLRLRVAVDFEAQFAQALMVLLRAFRSGKKLLLFGNGGSASDAQHLSAEFVGRYVHARRPLPAIALNTDTSALTAIGNDFGFEQIFARQVRALGAPGDVVIALTTSGKSPNVLEALTAAKELGLATIGFTGAAGSAFGAMCDVAFIVPSLETARVQEIHITVGHVLCEAVEEALLRADQPESEPLVATSKELPIDLLCALRERWREQRKVVVWTNGCFDLLHPGHLASLREARRFGDVLLVGINTDASIRHVKGPGRPVFPLAHRVAMLSGLESVDYVVPFEEPNPMALIERLTPDVHCKGKDYADGAPMPERSLVESYGGRVEFLDLLPGVSSSEWFRRIRATPSE
jgi:phosphoheptose isomerase